MPPPARGRLALYPAASLRALVAYMIADFRGALLALCCANRRLQGQRFIEWMEDSEWRKKLREEAHARCIRDKKDEDKGKERTERREGSGSTKKAAPKPKKVD